MPTYNFKSNGEIEIDGVVKQTIEGPAVLSPRSAADTFYLKYLDGNDLYYYSPNTYQIDGEEFEGSLAAFCVAASELYESAGGGGGESYPDITDDVSIAISSTKSFSIVDDDGKGLITAAIGTTDKAISLGDPDGLIETGPTSSVYTMRDSGSNYGTAYLNANYDGYTSQANIAATVQSATEAFVSIEVEGDTFSGGIQIDNAGFSFYGNGPAKFDNTKGVKLPNLTKVQRDALTLEAGLVIYQTDDTPGIRVCNGMDWMKFTETADPLV